MVLVTGGAGFIGSNLIKYLINEYPEYKIINFDKLTTSGNLNNLISIENKSNYVFLKGDISLHKDVKNVFEEFNPDYVVHLAAESYVEKSLINPDIYLLTNILGTQILLKYSREYNITKFVHLSTDEVYGSSQKKKEYFTENSPLAPNNPYAASKSSADLLLRVANQTFGQRVNIIRSCNCYGVYQFPDKLIPLMIHNSINDKELPVFGDGKYIRSWIHVLDLCRAIDFVMHNGKPGETYNVSSNAEWENLDLVEHILSKLDKSKDLIRFVIDRPGHDYRYSLDSTKIKNELDWKPLIEFEKGLEKTIEWYQNNQYWIEEILSGEYTNYYEQVYGV
ncbi:MAG: dTDP-glucose 4,6-dehydratase [Candidatus Cloacimonetes bacterium]|nr:dTDP-glucose 4,6-dehydratase [Candidatus Cloacimonadota bacterium]